MPFHGNVNLCKSHSTHFYVVSKILTFECLTLKIKVIKYNTRSDAMRWQMPTCLRVIASIFTLALTVSEILRFEMFDLENLGHGHGHGYGVHIS